PQQLAGDFLLWLAQLPSRDFMRQLTERKLPKLPNVPTSETHRRRIVAQAAAVTRRAIDLTNEVLQLEPQGRRETRRFFDGGIKPFELKSENNPTLDFRLSTFDFRLSQLKPLLARSVQNQPPVASGQPLERHIERNASAAAKRLEHGPCNG